ncbi:MAG: hypothetical protein INR71_12005, partial [Terriglobus roseus]|nr:hypothetical protein [Terriglobus roseus]
MMLPKESVRRRPRPLTFDVNSCSDFPSLSGSSQQQHQQHAQAQSLWANPSLRATQQTPIQRQQQAQGGQQSASNSQQQGQDGASAFGQGSGDDYGYATQSRQAGLGALSGLTQPQTNNVDEFPPLGGLGSVDVGADRRTGMIQNAAFGGGDGQASRYGGMGQSRLGLTSPDGQQDGTSLRLGGQRIPSGEEGRNGGLQRAAPGFDVSQQQPIGRSLNPDQDFSRNISGGDAAAAANNLLPHQPGRKRIADMSELDRWGIQGLLAMIPSDSPDHSSLAMGQDLTALGLDLNRPDNSPLYPTFGTPFGDHASADPNAPPRPVVPDFEKQLPPSYAVTNVPPLHTKMASFHEETLFAIFYTYAR